MSTQEENLSDPPGLPPRLVQELSALHSPQLQVPETIDRDILSQAKRSFARRVMLGTYLRRGLIGLAAAALIAIAVRVFVPTAHLSAPVAQPQIALRADINHDGKVDILDAYLVARKIARHEPLDPAWDINGDGIVDQKDVDLIATLAVHVEGGSRR